MCSTRGNKIFLGTQFELHREENYHALRNLKTYVKIISSKLSMLFVFLHFCIQKNAYILTGKTTRLYNIIMCCFLRDAWMRAFGDVQNLKDLTAAHRYRGNGQKTHYPHQWDCGKVRTHCFRFRSLRHNPHQAHKVCHECPALRDEAGRHSFQNH